MSSFFIKYQSDWILFRGMIERVVEELIMASMGSGDFSNLKGSGKPLKQDFSNPYIDETEKRINDILKNNGFAPPWIMKEAEIRVDMETIRKTLREEYARFQVLQGLSCFYDVNFDSINFRFRISSDNNREILSGSMESNAIRYEIQDNFSQSSDFGLQFD